MAKTNLEQYKEQLKKIFNENFDEPSDIFDEIQNNIDSEITINASQSYTDDILDWMSQTYKEHILNDTEKEYLADVIRPFREKVNTISKFHSWDDNSQYIYIETKDNHFATLPVFPKGTMYKGMKDGAIVLIEVGGAADELELDEAKIIKTLKRMVVAGVLLMTFDMLLPSKKTCYQMMIASQVTEENVKKAEDVIKDSVDYIFEKINTNNKGE